MARLRISLLLLLFVGILRAEEAASPSPTIGHIQIIRWNVFDSKNGEPPLLIHRIPNKLHVVTREGYIRRELLFKEGDPYDPAVVAETERLLRRLPIFRSVAISTAAAMDGTVDVTVETDDVWTTSPQIEFGLAGGETFYHVGFLEQNFLGQGKRVGAFVRQDVDRFIRGASYEDSQLLGSRWTGRAGYGADEKGREWELGLEKPLFAPSVPHAEGADVRVLEDEDRLFQDAEEAARFDHDTRDARVFAAHALNPGSSRIRRVTGAYERQDDKFSNLVILRPPRAVPLKDRTVSAALIGFEYKDLDFHQYDGVMTFDRIEDANQGWEWFVEAGPSLKNIGATRDGAFGRLQAQKIVSWGDLLWFNHLDASGRAESKSIRDGVMRLRSEAFLLEWRENNTASLRSEWIASRNLDAESQFLLGGDNGLRAYKIRQEAGANSLLVTLENRRVVLHDWLKLVSFGWAVFADAGTAWQRHSELRISEMKTDVGAGLRLAPSRSVSAGIIRIDLAYALQDNSSSSRLALNIGADLHFGESRSRKFDQ